MISVSLQLYTYNIITIIIGNINYKNVHFTRWISVALRLSDRIFSMDVLHLKAMIDNEFY